MKKTAAIITVILSALILLPVRGRAANGYTLTGLWTEYEQAMSGDKPQDALQCLDKIIDASSRRHLSWDFYEAWNRKVEVESLRNWKRRDAVQLEEMQAFAEFNEPIINVLTSGYDLEKLLREKDLLRTRSNKDFYGNRKFIDDDYEYLMWILWERQYDEKEKQKTFGQLRSIFGPVMDMCQEAEEIRREYYEMEGRKDVTEKEYVGFRLKCTEFEKRRKGLKGRDSRIAGEFKAVDEVIQMLDSKSLDVTVSETEIIVRFINLDEASLKVSRDGRAVFAEKVLNPQCRYHAVDSVSVSFPEVDDGEYLVEVENGDVVSSTSVRRHLFSIASTEDNDGFKLYAAHYKTGRPLDRYSIRVSDAENKVIATYGNFVQNGVFTPVPKIIASLLPSDRKPALYIQCFRQENGIERSSLKIPFRHKNGGSTIPPLSNAGMRAKVMTDRGAYHAEDTVRFKVIVYSGTYWNELSCAAPGTPVVATLLDPDGKQLCRTGLSTNRYGSAAGEFNIPEKSKGGRYSLAVTSGGNTLGTAVIVVDNFLLPDFTCDFEKIDNLCFAGDTVTVKGTIKAYNGHNVSSVSAYYTVEGAVNGADGNGVRHPMNIGQDGGFTIPVQTDKSRFWSTCVTVHITSATGQTLEFSKHVPHLHNLSFSVSLLNQAKGASALVKDGNDRVFVVADDSASFRVEVLNAERLSYPLAISYSIYRHDVLIRSGVFDAPEDFNFCLDGHGEYCLVLEASFTDGVGEVHRCTGRYRVVKVNPDSSALDADVEYLFAPVQGNDISFCFGATGGPVWAVATLYDGNRLLWTRMLDLKGERAKEGSLVRVSLPWKKDYPDDVALSVMYFRNGEFYRKTFHFTRNFTDENIRIELCRFRNNAFPSTEYSLRFKTDMDTETLVAVFDKSTETIAPNIWRIVPRISRMSACPYPLYKCGVMGDYHIYSGDSNVRPATALAKAGSDMEEAIPFQLMSDKTVRIRGRRNPEFDVRVRSDFSTTLYWSPFICTEAGKENEISFRTSDKTGTFVVSLFSHDKEMHSRILRKEFVVSLPVQLEIATPKVLHEGDRYVLRAVVSAKDVELKGEVTLLCGSSASSSRSVSVGAGESIPVDFPIEIPRGPDVLDAKVVFTEVSGKYSDAVAVKIPVMSSFQEITESHSAVLFPSSDRARLVEELKASFVNISPDGAECRETDIRNMVKAVLRPREGTETLKNAIELCEALSVNAVCSFLAGNPAADDGLKGKLLSLQNEDGGFSWFPEMESSSLITATVLEQCADVEALCRVRLLDESRIAKAVAYMDANLFSPQSYYRNTIARIPCTTLRQYLHVRSRYARIPFVKTPAVSSEVWNFFSNDVKEYLLPGRERGLNGEVSAKVVRLSTLENLRNSGGAGFDLLGAWGVRTSSGRLEKSLESDIASLRQYVTVSNAGAYLPNLVMPSRGLLESEVYFHALVAGLFRKYCPSVSDDIRLWLMLQKETQHWDNSFAFVSVACCILQGSEKLLGIKVISLNGSDSKPYSAVKAVGNGFSVCREFVLTSADGTKSVLEEGESLHTGDRITAVYRIWNEENRSFVRLKVPRPSCLWPCNQLSGKYGYWCRSISHRPGMVFSSHGYREVLADRTEYYFDSFPEDKTEISEDFFVTQAGVFTCPVIEIESLYAPHYRANAGYEGTTVSK